MELTEQEGPDGREAWVLVDGVVLARAEWIQGVGYHVDRDPVAPEMEDAVRALEDGPGTRDHRLEVGQVVGLDVSPPTGRQIYEARQRPQFRSRLVTT